MRTDEKLEALLFIKGEPVLIKDIPVLLNESEKDVADAIECLTGRLIGGVKLVRTEDSLQLATAAELSQFVEGLREDELSKDLGKAGAETLAIILYKGPVPRSEVDYIRGVNSSFTLRALMVRGLIKRVQNPKNQRSYLYHPTTELLTSLGVERVDALPEYVAVKSELENFLKIPEDADKE